MDLSRVTLAPDDIWGNSLNFGVLAKCFDTQGYLTVNSVLSAQHVEAYKHIYDKLISGEIDASKHRHDLGSHVKRASGQENITQIMWPSLYVPDLLETVIYKRLEKLAKAILGEDMAFDFDMMIAKPAQSPVCTPWHQDESYWLDMPDKRAVTFWVPLQDVYPDNGCMWFVPGSHKQPLRTHSKAKEGHHVNQCEGSEEEATAIPLSSGGCTAHHGRMCHYTRGNLSNEPRRAYIINYRPQSMVDFERSNGFDHGRKTLEGVIAVNK